MNKFKSNNLIIALLATSVFAVGCSSDDDAGGDPNPPATNGELTGAITESMVLDATVDYKLVGSVTVEEGATLTIPAGTKITSDQKDGLDVLIIKQGGKIDAQGSASDPIVFTESSKQIGAWGGIVLLGRAPINVPGGTSSPEFDDTIFYGGENASDNSGTLSYVRVEYAGAGIVEGSVEYNGFGFYAVGSGTTLNNLQTYRGSDDGFEWFGGTVKADNLLSIGDEDDSFDWTEGWSGGGSNWVAVKENIADRGIEADGNENDNTLSPMSKPTISGLTLVGVGESTGITLRRGTGAILSNVSITGFENGIAVSDAQTITNAQNGDLKIDGVFIGDVINSTDIEGDADLSSAIIFDSSATGADDTFTQGWTIGYEGGAIVSEELTGDVTSDKSLDANVLYTLKGSVIIQDGATLTIPAGTRITSDQSDGLDALIVNQGGKLEAVGTAEEPIVFTESSKQIGSWGGIVILGKAPINVPGGTSSPEFDDTLTYGGNVSDDNSGTLSYIRLEYAGAGIVDGSVEYNGFGFYAVGSGTTVNNLETYKGSDDGFEWFGGTVVADNLISIGDEDDSFDWTEGWSGGGSNWITIKENIADTGIEADGNESDNTLTPLSNPIISDITIVGVGESNGIVLRRGTAATITNAVIKNFATGISVADAQTETNVTDGILSVSGAMSQIANPLDVTAGFETVFSENAAATGADVAFAEGWSRFFIDEYSID